MPLVVDEGRALLQTGVIDPLRLIPCGCAVIGCQRRFRMHGGCENLVFQ